MIGDHSLRPDLSLVLVCYHSSKEAANCISSFREEAEALGLELEVLLIDHSETKEELIPLQKLNPDRLISRPNAGYAAGVNAGLREAAGELTFIANPDIVLERHSLEPLVAALTAGFDFVGPQLQLGAVLFPPAESQAWWQECRRQWSVRNRESLGSYLKRFYRRADRLWQAEEPVEVETLSGCLIGCTTQRARSVGDWDEAYFLYFEETDWLRRAKKQGYRCAQVPASRVTHRWGHSANPATHTKVFEASRERYYHRHYGYPGHWLARRRIAEPPPPLSWPDPGLPSSEELVWLVSASAAGFPAGKLLGSRPVRETILDFASVSPSSFPWVTWGYDTSTEEIFGPYSAS